MWQNFLIPRSVKFINCKKSKFIAISDNQGFLSLRYQYILFISIKRKIFVHLNVSNYIWFGFQSHDNHKFEMNKILVFDIRSIFCTTQILMWKDIYFLQHISNREFFFDQKMKKTVRMWDFLKRLAYFRHNLGETT